MPVINLDSLKDEAKKYQAELRVLPYSILGDELNRLGIALKPVAGIDVATVIERKGGLLRPYTPDGSIENAAELMKLKEVELKVETAVIVMKDNIKNYQTARILNNPDAVLGINQDGKHRFEKLITANIVRTASEDVLDALFHAKRNTADMSPLGAFDGLYKHIDDLITAGEIAAGKGNLISTGAITAPATADDTAAVDAIVNFVRSANYMLRRYPSVLYLNTQTYRAAIDALENKYKYKDVDLTALGNYINEKASSKVTVVVSDLLGSGSRIILTVPGNFELGINTMSSAEFVSVRDPYEDKNLIQFWLQADFGTRVLSVHQKMFAVNDQTNTAISLAGDYVEETTETTETT